jgi:hypothetical protein
MSSRPAALAALAASLVAGAAAAGEDGPPRHALSAAVGLRGEALREDLVVPLTFSGPGVRLMLLYRGEVGPGLLAVGGDFGLAMMWNRYGHPAGTIDHNFDAAWTVPVRRTPISHWALGAMLVDEAHFNLLFSWDDAHAYWHAAQWLGPAVRHGRRLSETWRLEARASFAVLGFQGRPPTYRYRKQETRPSLTYPFTQPYGSESFVSLAELQAVRVDVAFRRAAYTGSDVGRGWAFGLDLRFARTGSPATTIDLAACVYAARAWGRR